MVTRVITLPFKDTFSILGDQDYTRFDVLDPRVFLDASYIAAFEGDFLHRLKAGEKINILELDQVKADMKGIEYIIKNNPALVSTSYIIEEELSAATYAFKTEGDKRNNDTLTRFGQTLEHITEILRQRVTDPDTKTIHCFERILGLLAEEYYPNDPRKPGRNDINLIASCLEHLITQKQPTLLLSRDKALLSLAETLAHHLPFKESPLYHRPWAEQLTHTGFVPVLPYDSRTDSRQVLSNHDIPEELAAQLRGQIKSYTNGGSTRSKRTKKTETEQYHTIIYKAKDISRAAMFRKDFHSLTREQYRGIVDVIIDNGTKEIIVRSKTLTPDKLDGIIRDTQPKARYDPNFKEKSREQMKTEDENTELTVPGQLSQDAQAMPTGIRGVILQTLDKLAEDINTAGQYIRDNLADQSFDPLPFYEFAKRREEFPKVDEESIRETLAHTLEDDKEYQTAQRRRELAEARLDFLQQYPNLKPFPDLERLHQSIDPDEEHEAIANAQQHTERVEHVQKIKQTLEEIRNAYNNYIKEHHENQELIATTIGTYHVLIDAKEQTITFPVGIKEDFLGLRACAHSLKWTVKEEKERAIVLDYPEQDYIQESIEDAYKKTPLSQHVPLEIITIE